jgi:hypothetical protein
VVFAFVHFFFPDKKSELPKSVAQSTPIETEAQYLKKAKFSKDPGKDFAKWKTLYLETSSTAFSGVFDIEAIASLPFAIAHLIKIKSNGDEKLHADVMEFLNSVALGENLPRWYNEYSDKRSAYWSAATINAVEGIRISDHPQKLAMLENISKNSKSMQARSQAFAALKTVSEAEIYAAPSPK